MTRRLSHLVLAFALVLLVVLVSHADDGVPGDAVQDLASGDHPRIGAGISKLGSSSSEEALAILSALEAGTLKADSKGKVFVETDDEGVVDPFGNEGQPEGALSVVALNNQSRRTLTGVLSRMRLTAKNVDVRREAARKLSEYPDDSVVVLIRDLYPKESDEETKSWMGLALAKVDLKSSDKKLRMSAARAIVDSDDISLEAELKGLVGDGKGTEKDQQVRVEMLKALRAVQSRMFWGNVVANTIYGLSLGSVLVLAALGLAITFGLMRVINMAHGEMLMLGAYSTFFVRETLLSVAPSAAEWYLLLAIPFAFLTTFLMGVVLERLVIRHLYGRPLETLLATWGLSLILIQIVRVIFGAQNVTVANPEFLSGGWELLPALVVPYSRLFVLIFTACVVGFVWFILSRTSMGLKVRAVTQNREIASSLGVPTRRIDMWTFGLGSGLAGLGGVALSQLGNVGPELGQQHIIDSFMVVVLGGVGNILGTILAGVGLGIANKVLEPSVGAVLGKIMILCLLILFIQWRPQGLFALKGRAAEGA